MTDSKIPKEPFEIKALEALSDAERKNKPSFLSSIFGPNAGRQEEAADSYVRAANFFKMAKKWTNAGKAFESAATVHVKIGERKHEAASKYVDAATCYRKENCDEAIRCLNEAIAIYGDMGRFTIAAKQHVAIAELLEQNNADAAMVIQHYEQAADFYKGEESKSAANKCLLKVAHHAAIQEQYEKSIELFEQIGTEAVDSPLLKYAAKEYFFKAAVCHLCVDSVDTQNAVDRYCTSYVQFSDSREHKLLLKLLQAVEDESPEDFASALQEYDSISRLDQWYTTLLLRVKKVLTGDGDIK